MMKNKQTAVPLIRARARIFPGKEGSMRRKVLVPLLLLVILSVSVTLPLVLQRANAASADCPARMYDSIKPVGIANQNDYTVNGHVVTVQVQLMYSETCGINFARVVTTHSAGWFYGIYAVLFRNDDGPLPKASVFTAGGTNQIWSLWDSPGLDSPYNSAIACAQDPGVVNLCTKAY